MMIKTALITGGAGFIGSNLAEKLLSQGYTVLILDNVSTGSKDNIKHLIANKNLHILLGDVCDKNVTSHLIKKADIIFHLASSVGVSYIMNNKINSLLSNFSGASTVFECAAKEKKRVIFTSSSEIYGKNNQIPFQEDSLTVFGPTSQFRWSYGCSKMLAEHLAMAYYKEKNLPVSICRLFNTVGSKQTGKYGMVIPKFVDWALKNEDIFVYGTGLQTRCFVNVSDVIDALSLIADSSATIGETLNIGSSEEVTIIDLAKKIITITNSKSKIVHVNPKEILGNDFEDLERRVPDLNKCKRLIGFSQKKDLQTTLSEIIAYRRILLATSK